MRAILIDATNRTITEVKTPGKLEDLQKAVGGYIEVGIQLENNDSVYVNEEGLLGQPEHFFYIEGAHQPFAGNGIVMGIDTEEGDTISCKTSLEDFKKRVTFLTVDEVLRRK